MCPLLKPDPVLYPKNVYKSIFFNKILNFLSFKKLPNILKNYIGSGSAVAEGRIRIRFIPKVGSISASF